MANCTNCTNLQAQVSHLQAENQRLLIEVAMLRRIIEAAREECVALATEADKTLARRSGVAPRVWGVARGQGEAARKVLERLKG